MKTILCIAPYKFLPAETGGQKAIFSLYKTMSKNFRIICISTNNNKIIDGQGFEVRNILSDSPLRYINPFYYFTIKNIINKEKADYLQIEHPYSGWLAILLKRFTGVKLIVRSHNIEGLRFKNLGKWWWKLLLKYEKWVHRQANFNYFISDEDKAYAIKNFALSPLNCVTITFGINLTAPPSAEQRKAAKAFLLKEHKFDTNDVIILFNGAFNYQPNENALIKLVNHIFPLLKTYGDKSYKLIVCGKDIPADLIQNNLNNNIIFAGYVNDINTYLSGASIFVNPITKGGGIKTKLVEALVYNVNCVSFKTGAIGIPKQVCGDKLITINDDDFTGFANAITEASNITSDIPEGFYNYFSLDKILAKIVNMLG